MATFVGLHSQAVGGRGLCSAVWPCLFGQTWRRSRLPQASSFLGLGIGPPSPKATASLAEARTAQTRGGGDSGLEMSRSLSSQRFRSASWCLWLNNGLYGSPFRTGYGQLGDIFSLSAFSVNASRYFSWLVETHTPFPLLAFAAPFLVLREKREDAALSIGLILATCAIYFFYTLFDEWSYLRFLLPAIALMVLLASAVTVHLLTLMLSRIRGASASINRSHHREPRHLLRPHGRRSARVPVEISRTAVSQRRPHRPLLAAAECRHPVSVGQRCGTYFTAGRKRCRGRGSTRHGSTAASHGSASTAVCWYILVESWEEPAFRNRFGNISDIGNGVWPPNNVINTELYASSIRATCAKYDRGEKNAATEYLWPLRAIAISALREHAIGESLFGPTTLAEAIDRLGFVQADPILLPARAQDLILRHRVRGYHAGDLERHYASLGHRRRLLVCLWISVQAGMAAAASAKAHASSRAREKSAQHGHATG